MKSLGRLGGLGGSLALLVALAACGCRSGETRLPSGPIQQATGWQAPTAAAKQSEVIQASAAMPAPEKGAVMPAAYTTTSVYDGGSCSH